MLVLEPARRKARAQDFFSAKRVPPMPYRRQPFDYEPVTRSPRRLSLGEGGTVAEAWPVSTQSSVPDDTAYALPILPEASLQSVAKSRASRVLKRGHALTFAALFLFTIVLYIRPAELYPSPLTASIAFAVGLITLIIFVPSQFALEGTLTARPREVNLVLLLCLTGLLSIPFAKISAGDAWAEFSGIFIRAVVMFIVIVNAARTERRLRWLLLLALGMGCVLGVGAVNNYRLGNFAVEGYRVAGVGGGLFGNPNDMALHLVTMIPIAVAFCLSTRGVLRKILYGACIVLMTGGIFVTFSRGAFLAFVAVAIMLAWKIGHRYRVILVPLILFTLVLFFAVAPGEFANRILSIVDHSRDAVGSADSRTELLFQSIRVALRNPLFGIGMGNFHYVSIGERVTHNAYTQVGAEMGLAAFIIYTMFIVAPFKRLRQIERDSFSVRKPSRFYYLAVGLQVSLVAYMVASFFASVAYSWSLYYLVAYAVALRRIYEASILEDGNTSRNVKGEAAGGRIAALNRFVVFDTPGSMSEDARL
ncbi:MAG: O-antigen ligase family protein [Pyrinomonadaceae bacterium]